jgi:hypothetical protein
MKIEQKNILVGYFITLITLMLYASPFFMLVDVRIKFTFTMAILVYAFFKGKLRNIRNIFLILLAVYGLIIIQAILYGGFSNAGIYKPLLIFLTPFVLYRLFGMSYFKYLFWILYYGAIFTFMFWLIQNLIPTVDNFLQQLIGVVFPYTYDAWPRSLLFYTVANSVDINNQFGILRNAGFFHEAGAFSLYLMLAMIINTFFTRNTLDKKNVILAFILLTTFSTTGYILLALFLAYAITNSKMNPILKFLIIFILIIGTISTFRSEDFLKAKIEKHYSTQVESIQKNEVSGGRFYSFLKAYEVIKEYPLFGKGILKANIPVAAGAYYDWGPMGLFANYGIIFGFIYLIFYYQGLIKLCSFFGLSKSLAILFFIIIQAGLSTQAFFFHASYVMVFFIGLEPNLILEGTIIPTKQMLYKNQIIISKNQ